MQTSKLEILASKMDLIDTTRPIFLGIDTSYGCNENKFCPVWGGGLPCAAGLAFLRYL